MASSCQWQSKSSSRKSSWIQPGYKFRKVYTDRNATFFEAGSCLEVGCYDLGV